MGLIKGIVLLVFYGVLFCYLAFSDDDYGAWIP